MLNKPVIAVDVDAVLADLHAVWLQLYNQDFDDQLRPTDIHQWDMIKAVKPECGRQIYDYLHFKDLYDHVPTISGAVEGVKLLRQYGRVVFVTSELDGHFNHRKLDWLRTHGFGPVTIKDYIEMSDKSLLRANMLIDDYEGNLHPGAGLRVLFNQPWNYAADPSTYDIRILGWAHIGKFIEMLGHDHEHS